MPESPSGLKICHVFAGVEGGRWVYDQLERLRDEHGCDVHVVLGGESGPTVDLFRAAGIPVKSLDFTLMRMRSFFSFPFRILSLAIWMRRQRFDVVQSHVIQSTIFARPAAWLADVPVRLVMVTGPFYMQAPSTRRMERETVFMETGVIPSCELTARLYRESGVPERLILPTLYYGPRPEQWDPERAKPAGIRRELGFADDTPLIGSVAVFYPRCGTSSFVPPEAHNRHIKGHEELIGAMPLILQSFPDAKLLLIGKGWGPAGAGAEAELRELVREKGLEDSVIFTGYRSDIASLYRDLDVSVQASLNENLGGTVESLLMARPTVATRVGGMVDSVVDGETGLLAEPGDPKSLADAILRMLRDPDMARALGAAGRKRMLEGFTLSTTVQGLAGLYAEKRAGAPAFRLHRSIGRLAIAAILHVPVVGRALLVDMFLQFVLPNLWHSLVGRMWILGLRLTGRPVKRAEQS